MRLVGVVVVLVLCGAAAWFLLPVLLLSSPAPGPWIVLAALFALAGLVARAVSPRSLAIAAILVAFLAAGSGAILDLRVLQPLWVGLLATLGCAAAAVSLARIVLQAGPEAGEGAKVRADGRTKALAFFGLAANLALVAFSYHGVAATTRSLAARERVKIALHDMRAVLSAEESYRSVNGGFYDRIECVATERPCIPGYPATAPTFLDPAVARPVKDGYRRSFHAGPPADPGEILRAKASPSSLQGFAYMAVPFDGDLRGAAAYCGDHTGRLCATGDGVEPVVRDGRCGPPPACLDLR